MGLGKDDKLGHVRDTDDLSIHLGGEVHRFLDLPTVYEPEPRNYKAITGNNEAGCLLAATVETATDIQQMYLNKLFFVCYLADTLVVKETQSLTNVSGVVPVISSHWAGVVPPAHRHKQNIDMLQSERLV